jgi:pimeloyl-ACP methyl ester carboxylesterase
MDDHQADGTGHSRPHLVVLVHGIRTRARWYIDVRDALAAAGFQVSLTNYGRFGLPRFLLPIRYFRERAATDIEGNIREAMEKYGVDRISVIAHSFGTFVIGWILRNRFDIKFTHIIFCGSVLPFRFPFQFLGGQFQSLVNEVGTRDIWPILADSVTWGYGSTGAFGFNRPEVFDRHHKGLSHSAFLNADFCRKWWIPVLQGGAPQSHDSPGSPPWWLRLLDIFHIKYLLIMILALWGWTAIPDRKFMLANIGMVCTTSDSEPATTRSSSAAGSSTKKGNPQTATSLLVIISSERESYIKQIGEFLRDKSKMEYAETHEIRPVQKNSEDPLYNIIEEYKASDQRGTSDLLDPKDWMAYAVKVVPHPGTNITYVPVPTIYGVSHKMRFFVIVSGRRPPGQEQEQAELNAAVLGITANTSPQLALVSEITPQTGPDLTKLKVWVVGNQACW